MGLYTITLTPQQKASFSKVLDVELSELLGEVRSKVSSDYYIQEDEKIVTRFLRKPKKSVGYTVYYEQHTSGFGTQIVNLATESDNSMAGISGLSKSSVMNYLMGLLNGYLCCQQEQESMHKTNKQ